MKNFSRKDFLKLTSTSATVLILNHLLPTSFASSPKIETLSDTALSNLYEKRAQLICLRKFDELATIDKQLKNMGVEFLSSEDVAKKFAMSSKVARVSRPTSANVTWTSKRVNYTYNGVTYEIQTLTAQPKNDKSKLYLQGNRAISSTYNWAAGRMNAIKVIAEAYISSKISKTQQLLLTFYDIISSVATGIKKETVLSAAAVMYTHSSTSTVSFKYVKVKGQSDSEQDLCYVSTMCTSVFATQSSKLTTENGTAIPSVQQWQKTIVSKPAGYDSDLNAVKSFAGTSTQRNAFVWAIDVTGIENKTVFSISPLAPQTPVQVS
ncbi:hypothetical protein [Faecalibacterium prausnitzii]|uniref:hypothetical protein n=1 Tax=Faecalibacterium prausnitzii TaxID=853 RepID=UPI0032B5BC4A